MKTNLTDENLEPGEWPEQYSGPLPTLRHRKSRHTLRTTLVSAVTVLSLTGGYFASGFLSHLGHDLHASRSKSRASDAAAPSGSGRAGSPTSFTDRQHAFAAGFTGTPFKSTQKDTFYDGSPLLVDYFDVYDAGTAQMVSVTDLPCNFDPSTVRDVMNQRWDIHVKSLAGNLSGTAVVKFREETTVQSFTAMRGTFTITDSKGRKTTGALLSIMHGASMIHVLTTSEAPATPESDKQQKAFLDSFRLLDQAVPGRPICRAALGGSAA